MPTQETRYGIASAGGSADLVQLAYIPESSYGVVPGSGTPRAVRYQSESLVDSRTYTADKEMSADGQQGGSTLTDAQTTGDIKVHVQYAEHDAFTASALRSAWAVFGTNGVSGAPFSGTFTANTVQAGVAPTGNDAFTTLQPGQWFQLNAPGDVNDGAWVRNSTTVAATSTLITLDPSTVLQVSGPVANCTIATSRLSNGSTLSGFSIEKQSTDMGQFLTFKGQIVSKMSVAFADGATTDATYSFMGKTANLGASTQLPGGGTVTPSYTYEIHNGVTGIGNLWENGSPLTSTKVKTLSFDFENGLRSQKALANLGPVGMGQGTVKLTGKITVYFKDGSLYTKYQNGTYTSLVVSTKGPDGAGYVYTLSRVKLEKGQVLAGGKDTDLMAEFDFTAYGDRKNANVALRKTIIIDRLGPAIP